MAALEVHAGPRALRHLQREGWRAADIRVVPAAAGGPKGLVLVPLDRYLFGDWLSGDGPPLHLVGASIGAWRMAAACARDADRALAEMAELYVTQHYPHAPGRRPTARQVSRVFGGLLDQHLGPRAAEVLAHPRRRLHVVTSRGRHLLARDGRWRTPLGLAMAVFGNAVGRTALSAWLERVLWSDVRDALPLDLGDFRTRSEVLDAARLARVVLASCSIPFWLEAVDDGLGPGTGTHWDGGLTDYHLHWRYGSMDQGLVLYPHFQPRLVPGWLDKPWRRRHAAGPALDNLVLLVPSGRWVSSLPGAKLPDRNDFKAWAHDPPERIRRWRVAVAESQRLADEFGELVGRNDVGSLRPLD